MKKEMETKQQLAADLKQKVEELNNLVRKAEAEGLSVTLKNTSSKSQIGDLLEVEISEEIFY